MFVDFDGSLSPIVAHPDLARPADGAREALTGLAGAYRVVAVITGRTTDEIRARLPVPNARYVGVYGLQDEPAGSFGAVVGLAQRAAASVPEAWVEDKGVTLAVHYRGSPDPAAARSELLPPLRELAVASGLDLVEGKMVLELVPPGRPLKGGALERIAEELELRAALYAGDDHADLDAFAALDRLAARGVLAIRVAVRGPETPSELLEGSDVVVDGPPGLVDLLRRLAVD